MQTNSNNPDSQRTGENNPAQIAARAILTAKIPERVIPQLQEKYNVDVPDGATYGEMLEAKAKEYGW